MKDYQAKQQAQDLMVGGRNWVEALPAGYIVQLRIDAVTQKEHRLPSGGVFTCSDLQWHLGDHYVPEAGGSALMLVGPDGQEVKGVFKRRAYT